MAPAEIGMALRAFRVAWLPDRMAPAPAGMAGYSIGVARLPEDGPEALCFPGSAGRRQRLGVARCLSGGLRRAEPCTNAAEHPPDTRAVQERRPRYRAGRWSLELFIGRRPVWRWMMAYDWEFPDTGEQPGWEDWMERVRAKLIVIEERMRMGLADVNIDRVAREELQVWSLMNDCRHHVRMLAESAAFAFMFRRGTLEQRDFQVIDPPPNRG
jgi:hypothetical protein